MRAQEAALERKYEFFLARFDQDHETIRLMEQLAATRAELIEENRMLREYNETYLSAQNRVENALAHLVETARAPDECFQPDAEPPSEHPTQQQQTKAAEMRLKQAMTLDECHEIARQLYTEIRAFSESEHFISSGMSAFGWTDRRRVESDQLKFSLQKTFPNQSAYSLMARTWSVVSSPDVFQALHSESVNMRCELVQLVDHSNVVIYQEYHVRERNLVAGRDATIVKRCLLLHTFFETESGYVILFCSLDPDRLADWPHVCGSVPNGATVKLDTLPSFSWMAFERDGPFGEDCKVSQVGTQDSSRAYWAVEMLQVMLRWERGAIGPVQLLPDDMDWSSS